MTATAEKGAAPVVVSAEKESEIILPPPTALNPVPALPAALRLDNQEQLMSLLKTNPLMPKQEESNFRQLLVFGTESLRTLLMRQVLSDRYATQNVYRGVYPNLFACPSIASFDAASQSVSGAAFVMSPVASACAESEI